MSEIKIKDVANGYILETKIDDEIIQSVYEYDHEDQYGDIMAAQKLFYAIIDELGLFGSKHDAKRLRVIIEENKNE